MSSLSDFPEKRLIEELFGRAAATAQHETFDDAVVIDLREITGTQTAPLIVYSLDQPSFVKHRDKNLSAYRFYGRWVAAATTNDVIAMGAVPKGFSLALSAPQNERTENIRELVAGITEVLAAYGSKYEGGNIDSSNLATVGYAWGVVKPHALIRRTGANVDDIIVVTGELGTGWLEYCLRKDGSLDFEISEDDRETLLAYKRMPVAAAKPIAEVADRGWFTSGMDLSDGLVDYLYTIAAVDGRGVLVSALTLPTSSIIERNAHLLASSVGAEHLTQKLRLNPWLASLEAGYDSPLRHAFTIRAANYKAAAQIFIRSGFSLQAIGKVVRDGVSVEHDGRRFTLEPFWDDQMRQQDVRTAWSSYIERFEV